MLYISSQTQKIHTTRMCSVGRRNYTVNLETSTPAKELADRGYVGCKRCGAFDIIESAKKG
jgi:hypothetical protein